MGKRKEKWKEREEDAGKVREGERIGDEVRGKEK
jgi:hypothetical protein